jgi:hypothetical protein
MQGVSTALSPLKSPEQKAGGVIQSTLSFGILGFQAVRWSRQSVFKYRYDRVKKANVKVAENIGDDLIFKTKDGVLNRVVYGEQKTRQFVSSGRRVIVTTKGRELLRKTFGIKTKNLYDGIPTQQTKTLYARDVFSGKRYVIRESAYQKTLKRLIKEGYSPSQAKQRIRYTAPRFEEQILRRGVIGVKDTTATGTFIFDLRKPRILVNEKLGIYTRGGKTLRDTINFQRKVMNLNNNEVMFELRSELSQYISSSSRVLKLKSMNKVLSISWAKAGEVTEGKKIISTTFKNKDGKLLVDILKDAKYRKLFSVNRDLYSVGVAPTRKDLFIELFENKGIVIKKSILFQKEIDLTKGGYGGRIIPKIRTSSSSEVEKAILNLEKSKQTSVYSGATNIQKSTSEVLKTDVQAISKPTQSSSSKVNMDSIALTTTQSVSSSIKSLNLLANRVVPKYKEKLDLKVLLKNKIDMRTSMKSMPVLKQQPKQSAQQTSLNRVNISPVNLITPLTPPVVSLKTLLNPPRPPKPPRIKIYPFGKGRSDALKDLIKKQSFKRPINFALLPDFTSRSLGLKAKEYDVKDLDKALRKTQTGFEIRTGAKIRRVNEKNLLKGISA